MRRIALSLVCCLTAWSGAAAAEIRFVGLSTITSKSGTCDWDPTGDRFVTNYRPANLGDNPSWSGFAWITNNWAQAFAREGGFGTTAKAVDYNEIFVFDWTGDYTVKVAFKKQDPKTLNTSDNFIDIEGTMTNFGQMKGCTVNFRMALTRKIE